MTEAEARPVMSIRCADFLNSLKLILKSIEFGHVIDMYLVASKYKGSKQSAV